MYVCVYISCSRVKLPSKVCAPTKGVKRTNGRLRVALLHIYVCMYGCTSRPNLGNSASARTKNKGKDWEEPLLRSSSCGLLMLMAAFQAAICVCVAGKGLGRGDQQGEGCMYVCMYVWRNPLEIHTYICIDACRTFQETLPKMSTPCVFV